MPVALMVIVVMIMVINQRVDPDLELEPEAPMTKLNPTRIPGVGSAPA